MKPPTVSELTKKIIPHFHVFVTQYIVHYGLGIVIYEYLAAEQIQQQFCWNIRVNLSFISEV